MKGTRRVGRRGWGGQRGWRGRWPIGDAEEILSTFIIDKKLSSAQSSLHFPLLENRAGAEVLLCNFFSFFFRFLVRGQILRNVAFYQRSVYKRIIKVRVTAQQLRVQEGRVADGGVERDVGCEGGGGVGEVEGC